MIGIALSIFLEMSSLGAAFGQDTLVLNQVSENNLPVTINTLRKDFGVIKQKSKAVYTFEITNQDEKPMVIWHVTTSCGCTSPTWTDKPVKKGEVGMVKVKYDTSQTGKFEKSVFVYTNFSDRPIKLIIEGTVTDTPIKNSKVKSGYTKNEVHIDSNINPNSK
ncbi:MAG: DUF1573 domain-containing protein [Salinivirgaceae bacterium]|jgi:hypothetical protein